MVTYVWCVMRSALLRAQITAYSQLDMINIFEIFLPQLLRYPNPNDPLNGDAAALLMRHPKDYDAKVKGRVCFFVLK